MEEGLVTSLGLLHCCVLRTYRGQSRWIHLLSKMRILHLALFLLKGAFSLFFEAS